MVYVYKTHITYSYNMYLRVHTDTGHEGTTILSPMRVASSWAFSQVQSLFASYDQFVSKLPAYGAQAKDSHPKSQKQPHL